MDRIVFSAIKQFMLMLKGFRLELIAQGVAPLIPMAKLAPKRATTIPKRSVLNLLNFRLYILPKLVAVYCLVTRDCSTCITL